MQRYGVVYADIWGDRDFKKLSVNARLLYIYLLSSPHSNMAGFYNLPTAYGSYDTQLSEADYLNAMEELNENGFILSSGETVLVKSYLKHNPVQTDKQAKGAWKQIERNPLSQLTVDFVHACILYAPQIIPHLSGEVLRYLVDNYTTANGIDIRPRLSVECPTYKSILNTLT